MAPSKHPALAAAQEYVHTSRGGADAQRVASKHPIPQCL